MQLCLDFTKAESVKIYMFMQAVYFPFEWDAMVVMVGFNTDQTWVSLKYDFSLHKGAVWERTRGLDSTSGVMCSALWSKFDEMMLSVFAFFGNVGKGSQTGGARSRCVQPWLQSQLAIRPPSTCITCMTVNIVIVECR